MSAAPRPASPPAGPRSTASRPSLTERRKAETQQEIAKAAAALFAARGASAVTAEDVARESGVSLRTFYRYFRTKEEAVAPLLTGGVHRWLGDLAAVPAGTAVTEALEQAVRTALTPADAAAEEALRWTRGLLRGMPEDPALRSVWHRVHADSEEALLPVLRKLAGADADPLEVRLLAAAANTAMRVAVEDWALADEGEAREPADAAVRCVRKLTAGLRVT